MGREDPLSLLALLGLVTLAGCESPTRELPPFAEVRVVVDTNLRVPQTLSRVRFDIFDAQRRWLTSRDIATPEAGDFPLSFSLYSESPSEPRRAWLRVRGYLDGRLRDYQGENFAERPQFEPPSTSRSLAAACRDAPSLVVGQPQSLRFRSEPFAGGELECEASSHNSVKRVQSGLGVFQLPIDIAGSYRVAVTSVVPGVDWAFVADTVLSLRRDCEAPDSELSCNDDENVALSNMSGVRLQLEPGNYFVLVGNVAQGPMDVTLLAEQDQSLSSEPTLGGGELRDPSPRLLVDGVDQTPSSEPDPNLAVDRLVELELEPAEQSTVRLLLDGQCLGTMADLGGSRSCVAREGVLDEVTPEPLLVGRLAEETSAVGSWPSYGGEPCSDAMPTPHAGLYDERQCVPGGSFLLGDPTLIARDADSGTPERLATIPTFAMDRYEYTVGRYRAARARGFVPPDVGPYNNPLPLALVTNDLTVACTWNEMKDGSSFYPEREALPLSCVSWQTARALCELDGGSLPSVAQREFAASAAERDFETSYPWGELAPGCDQVVFGRWPETNHGDSSCLDASAGVGPRVVDAEPWASFDVTPSGVVGLGGNVAEWTLDSHRAYSDACWKSQPHSSPLCDEPEAPLRTIAGGSWRSPATGTRAALRVGGAAAGVDPWVGLRCVYANGSP